MYSNHVRLLFLTLFISISLAEQVSVSKQIPYIKKVCAVFERDGRAEFVFELLSKTPLKDPSCPACSPLTIALKASCRPDKGEPAKKQRDPHPSLLYWTTILGDSINDDRKSGYIWQAFEKLLFLLTGDFPDRPPAEREYFETFRHYLIINKKTDDKPLEIPTVNVGSLFE